MVNYVSIQDGIQFKSDLQNSDTRSAQHDHLASCYRPALFFHHFSFNALSFRQGKFRHVSNNEIQFWYDFDRASSLICGNKMPTRCNRGFYCRSYFLLNIFRAPLCPSSGVQEYYTVLYGTKYHRQQPPYNTLELLMMGIVVPETCWASNKICNRNLCCI